MIGWVCGSESLRHVIERTDLPSLLDHYTILVILTHGILVDAAVIIAMACKNRADYQRNHEVVGIFLVGLIFVESVIAGVRGIAMSSVLSPKFDVLTLICLVVQVIYGYKVQGIITAKKNGQSYDAQKYLHRFLGLLLFALLKIKLLNLLKLVLRSDSLFWLVLAAYFFLCLLVYGYFFLFSDPTPKERELGKLYERHDDRAYQNIRAQIVMGDFNPMETGPKTHRLSNDNLDKDDPDAARSAEIKWYLFGNKLCEAPSFPHSGGDFLISAANRKDITKTALGIASWVYYNKETKDVHLFRYAHGKKFKNEVRRSCFGLFSQPIFYRGLEKSPSWQASNEDMRALLGAPHDRDYKRHKVYEHSGLQIFVSYSMQIAASEFYLAFIAKEGESTADYHVDLKGYWPAFIGKYFMANFQIDGIKIGNFIHFLSPNYLRFRNQALLNLDKELYEVHASVNTDLLMRVLELEDRKGSETTTRYCVSVLHSNHDLRKEKFNMSDYLGFGFGHLVKSSESHLLVVKNQGILPFIDFFELMFQKMLLYFHGRAAENEIFGNEYRLIFANKFRLSIYWYIDWEFAEAARSLGLYHLQLLKRVQEKLGSPDADLIGNVYIDSHQFDHETYDRLKRAPRRTHSISEVIATDPAEYDKILISGNDTFVTQMFGGAKISRRNFAKMVFI